MQGACLVIVHVCLYVATISVHVAAVAGELETSVTCNVRCVRVHVMNPETDDNNNNATGTRQASRRSRQAEADRPARVPTAKSGAAGQTGQESRCEV